MDKLNQKEAYKFYELLYDQYAPKAYGFLLQNTNSKEEAENLLTDIFLNIWKDLETFKTDTEKQIKKMVVSSYYHSQSRNRVLHNKNQLI